MQRQCSTLPVFSMPLSVKFQIFAQSTHSNEGHQEGHMMVSGLCDHHQHVGNPAQSWQSSAPFGLKCNRSMLCKASTIKASCSHHEVYNLYNFRLTGTQSVTWSTSSQPFCFRWKFPGFQFRLVHPGNWGHTKNPSSKRTKNYVAIRLAGKHASQCAIHGSLPCCLKARSTTLFCAWGLLGIWQKDK